MSNDKIINSKLLVKELENSKLSDIYLFLGEEEGEKDKLIAKIKELYIGKSQDVQNSCGNYHLENDELFEAVEFALMPSIFYAKKICVMRNIEGIKSNQSSKNILSQLFSNELVQTIIIMTSSLNKVPDILPKQVYPKITMVQFWKFFDSDIIKYINIASKRAGINILDSAIPLLMEKTGNDIKKLDEAIEIIKFYSQGKIIGNDDIEYLVNDGSKISIYEFINQLFCKDTKSLSMLKNILDEGTSEGRIIFEIIKHLEKIEKYHQYLKTGLKSSEAVSKCGIFAKNTEAFLIHTRSFHESKLNKVYSATVKCDLVRKMQNRHSELISNPLLQLVNEIAHA